MPINKLPRYSKAYIFGSALKSPVPNDIDLLIVYDDRHCASNNAYEYHGKVCDALRAATGLPIHLTLLTPSEEGAVKFIERTGAVPLEHALSMVVKK